MLFRAGETDAPLCLFPRLRSLSLFVETLFRDWLTARGGHGRKVFECWQLSGCSFGGSGERLVCKPPLAVEDGVAISCLQWTISTTLSGGVFACVCVCVCASGALFEFPSPFGRQEKAASVARKAMQRNKLPQFGYACRRRCCGFNNNSSSSSSEKRLPRLVYSWRACELSFARVGGGSDGNVRRIG